MQAKKLTADKLAQLFVIHMVSALLLSVLTWWIAGSYFGVNIFASISFPADDGWCAGTDALGVHCFGDFHYPVLMAMSDNPWSGVVGTNPYNGLGMVPFWLFGQTIEVIGSVKIGLFVYMVLLFASLSVPFFWVSFGRKFEFWPLMALCVGPFAIPGVMALDRGNTAALLVGPLLWFLVSFLRNDSRQIVISVAVLAAVKPQYGLLVILLLAYREWKLFLRTGVVIAGTQFLGYLLWPSSFPETILQSFRMTLSYQSISNVVDVYPPQISLASGVYYLEKLIRNLVGSQIPYSGFVSVQHQTKVGFLFVALLFTCLFLRGRHLPKFLTASILVAAISMISATTYAYYGVFALAIAAILIRNPLIVNSKESENELSLSPVQASSLALALVLTLTRFPLASTFLVRDLKLVETSTFLTPISWVIVGLVWMIDSFKYSEEDPGKL